MNFTDLRKDLQQMVVDAEEYAIKSIQESNDFTPYIYTEGNKLKKIITDDLEEAIETAHEIIEEDIEEETAIFVYNDCIEFKDGEITAIVLQIFDFNEDFGYSFGLGYNIENNTIKFLNQRVFLGNIRNVLIF